MEGKAVGKLTQRQSHVQEQMVELDNTINITQQVANDIRNRLSSVLTQPEPKKEGEGTDRIEMVPLAEQIREAVVFLRNINDTLQDTFNRIEL